MNLPLLVEIPAVLMPLVSRNRESFQAAVMGAEGLFAGRGLSRPPRSHRYGFTPSTVGAGSAREGRTADSRPSPDPCGSGAGG